MTIKQKTFDNGLTLVFEAMPWLSSVSLSLLVPFGAITDPEDQQGSATVLNDWLERGAGDLSSKELSERFDDLGVRGGGNAGKEYSTFSASMLASSFAEALPLYADIVRRPKLLGEEFAPAQTLAQQELASLDDSPTQKLFERLSQTYFASAHGRSAYGSREGLAALSAENVRQDYAQRVGPKGSILSVAGGLEWDEVVRLVESQFGDWQGDTRSSPEVKLSASLQEHIEEDSAQAQIGLAYKAVAPGEAGWYENALAMGVLSGGMGARLFTEVREKRGLVYSVAAVSRAVKGFGYSLGYAGTTPERADETLDVLTSELRRLKQGVSEDELKRSRTGLLSQLVMQGESSGARASALARDTFLLGEPRRVEDIKTSLDNITLNSLNQYLAQHYDPRFTVLTLGPKALQEVAL